MMDTLEKGHMIWNPLMQVKRLIESEISPHLYLNWLMEEEKDESDDWNRKGKIPAELGT